MSIDDWVTEAIQQFIEDEKDWLYGSFRRALAITKGRSSKKGYGFEWAIHTALAHWLLRNPDVQKLTIGEKCCDGRKPDLSFSIDSQKVLIELKTSEKGDMSFVANDLKKEYSAQATLYYLLFSYPYYQNDPPALNGAQCIHSGTGPLDFKYYLFRRPGYVPAIECQVPLTERDDVL